MSDNGSPVRPLIMKAYDRKTERYIGAQAVDSECQVLHLWGPDEKPIVKRRRIHGLKRRISGSRKQYEFVGGRRPVNYQDYFVGTRCALEHRGRRYRYACSHYVSGRPR